MLPTAAHCSPLRGSASTCILPVNGLYNVLSAGRLGGERPSPQAGSPRRGASRRCHRGGHPPPRRPRPAHRWPRLAGVGHAPASPSPDCLVRLSLRPRHQGCCSFLSLTLLSAANAAAAAGRGRGATRASSLFAASFQFPAAAPAHPPFLSLRPHLVHGPASRHRHGGAARLAPSCKSEAGQSTAGPTWT